MNIRGEAVFPEPAGREIGGDGMDIRRELQLSEFAEREIGRPV